VGGASELQQSPQSVKRGKVRHPAGGGGRHGIPGMGGQNGMSVRIHEMKRDRAMWKDRVKGILSIDREFDRIRPA